MAKSAGLEKVPRARGDRIRSRRIGASRKSTGRCTCRLQKEDLGGDAGRVE